MTDRHPATGRFIPAELPADRPGSLGLGQLHPAAPAPAVVPGGTLIVNQFPDSLGNSQIGTVAVQLASLDLRGSAAPVITRPAFHVAANRPEGGRG